MRAIIAAPDHCRADVFVPECRAHVLKKTACLEENPIS
jgi:hypothetical protein